MKITKAMMLNENINDDPKFNEYDKELRRFRINLLTWINPLVGGLADNSSPLDFDLEQLKKGIEVEKEHTNDPDIALKIAMDHLFEIPDYYDRLEKMEREAGVHH